MRRLWDRLVGTERAASNAEAACTELSRRRVERDEVELFLAALQQRSGRTRRSA